MQAAIDLTSYCSVFVLQFFCPRYNTSILYTGLLVWFTVLWLLSIFAWVGDVCLQNNSWAVETTREK